MISLAEAKKVALSVYEETMVIRTFEFEDFYVFQIDYVDYNGIITPGMQLIQVFKDSGKYAFYHGSLEKAKRIIE